MTRPTSAERAARLLAILHLLEPGSELSLANIADALGVTSAEAANDLEMLACCGLAPYTPEALVPVLLDGGVALVWGDLPALDRTVRLSTRQAHAVLTALEAAGVPPGDSLHARLAEAASSEALTPESFERVISSARDGDAHEVFKAAALALTQGRVLRLVYQSAHESSPRERLVEPLSLVFERGHWYLEAYDPRAGEVRTFRLDRARESGVLAEKAPERSIAPARVAFASEGLPVATVRFGADESVTERDWPGIRIVESDATHTLAEIPYSGTAWIARRIVSRLGGAEVLGPPEVRDAVRELAEASRPGAVERFDD